jgi:hypothetical protein
MSCPDQIDAAPFGQFGTDASEFIGKSGSRLSSIEFDKMLPKLKYQFSTKPDFTRQICQDSLHLVSFCSPRALRTIPQTDHRLWLDEESLPR